MLLRVLMFFLISYAQGAEGFPTKDEIAQFATFVKTNYQLKDPGCLEALPRVGHIINVWISATHLKGQRNIKAIQAKTAAQNEALFFIMIVHNAFDSFIQKSSQMIQESGLTLKTPLRENMVSAYQSNHHQFLTYTALLKYVLGERYASMLEKGYGLDSDLSIGWIRDASYVLPFPYNKKHTRNQTLYTPFPYGPSLASGNQLSVTLSNGKFVTSPHMVVGSDIFDLNDPSISPTVKLTLLHGTPAFSTAPIKIRMTPNHTWFQSFMAGLYENGDSDEMIKRKMKQGVCLSLPENPQEESIFFALLLEELTQSNDVIYLAQGGERQVEGKGSDVPEPTLPEDSTTNSTNQLLRLQNIEPVVMPLYAQAAQEQKKLDQTKKPFITGKPSHQKAAQKGRGKSKGLSGASQPKEKDDQPLSSETDQQTLPSLTDIQAVREQGRLKYRDIVKLVADTIRDHKQPDDQIHLTVKGSHYNLHIKKMRDGKVISTGKTLVKLHNGRTLSAQEGSNLCGDIAKILE